MHVLQHGMGDQHPVERIAEYFGQAAGDVRVAPRDGERLKPLPCHRALEMLH
jgi:hypothetical protein